MSDDRRRAAATATTGGVLVSAGALARHTGIERAVEASGKPHPRIHPTALLGGRAGRRLWLTGTAAGTIGASGMGVGLHSLASKPRRDESLEKRSDTGDFIHEGLAGNLAAVQERSENLRRPQGSKRARAAAAGASLAAGSAGSAGASRLLQHTGRLPRLRPAVTALVGTTAAVGSLPVTNAVARRHGYEVTPTGVKRRKKPPVRPTSMATVIETRAGRSGPGNTRAQIVPSDEFRKMARVHLSVGRAGSPACGAGAGWSSSQITSTRGTAKVDCPNCIRTNHYKGKVSKYYGEDISPHKKRAMVIGAGAAPVVGPYLAAGQAARTAPPEQRHSAAALQLGGYGTGVGLGLAGGAHLGAHVARTPQGEQKMQAATDKINSARTRVAGKAPKPVRRFIAPHPGNSRVAEHVARIASRPGALGRFAKPLATHPGAAALGGYAGKAVGGAIGGYAGYSAVLAREKKRNEKVGKLAPATGMTRREQSEQLERKKRNLGISMVATGLGATGVGILGAREIGPHLPRIGDKVARHSKELERVGLATALGGGGVSSYQGAQSARIQRRDLKAQQQVLASKGLGPMSRGLVAGVMPKSLLAAAAAGAPLVDHRAIRGMKISGTATGVGIPAAAYYQGKRVERKKQKELASKAFGIPRKAGFRASTIATRRTAQGMLVPVRRANTVAKVDTTLSQDEAQQVKAKYGLRGPLPRDLDRPTRMKAYEGRYIAAGGPKGEKWQQRADNLDHVTGGALAVGGAGALTQLHNERRANRLKALKAPTGAIHAVEHHSHRAGRIGLAAGGVGAISELGHRHAQHRAASYRSSPAGVAASALRRMRDYTPE